VTGSVDLATLGEGNLKADGGHRRSPEQMIAGSKTNLFTEGGNPEPFRVCSPLQSPNALTEATKGLRRVRSARRAASMGETPRLYGLALESPAPDLARRDRG
jgi:hypothetical protein